jgi:type II secretory pathway component PulM
MLEHWRSAVILLFVMSTPASASPCGDKIQQLDAKLKQAGRQAIATNSSGQAVAAERDSKDQTAPKPKADKATGEGYTAAQVSLNAARVADGKGDAKACDENVAKAVVEAGS